MNVRLLSLILTLVLALPAAIGGTASDAGEVTTDAQHYARGDTAEIRYHNPTDHTTYLPNGGPWCIRDALDEYVYCPLATQAIKPVAPGETVTWTYTLIDFNEEPLPPGDYTVTLSVYDGLADDDGFGTLTTLRSEPFTVCPDEPETLEDALLFVPYCSGVIDTVLP